MKKMEIKFADSFYQSMYDLFGPWGRFKTSVRNINPIRKVRNTYQRGTRGYANADLWSLHRYLGAVIYKSIKAFRESKRVGYPVLKEKFFDSSTSGNGMSDKSSQEAIKYWEEELKKMEEGWRILSNWDEISNEILEKYKERSKQPHKIFLGVDVGSELTDEERKAMNDECDKIYAEASENAKKLIDYFGNLWD